MTRFGSLIIPLIFAFSFVLSLVPFVSAQISPLDLPARELPPSYVVLDILTTRGVSRDSTRVDCIYRLSNDVFNFIRSNDKFVAHYELSLIVNDRDGFQMLGKTIIDSVKVDKESDTRVDDPSKAQLFSTTLPPGKYTLNLKIYDTESRDQVDITKKFQVPDYYENEVSISDLQFAGLITPETSPNTAESGVNVVPNILHAYGEDLKNMYVYFEVYSNAAADSQDPLRIRYKVKSATGQEFFFEESELKRQGSTGIYSHQVDTEHFPQGTYTIEVTVRDEAIKKSAQVKGEFYVSWRYLLPLRNAKNYQEIVDQLSYIASNDELKILKKLKKASSNEQQAALTAFWKRRDPTPETEKNERMLIHYSRVDYANQHFTASIGRGWKSDQGRVYIVYGPPDEVQSYTMEVNTNPYQIWAYNSINRRFTFVDFDGYGNYQLYRVTQ